MAPILTSFNNNPTLGFYTPVCKEAHIFSYAFMLSSSFSTKVKLYFFAWGSSAILLKNLIFLPDV